MDVEIARELCLAKPCAEESTPFGPDVLVYKVGEKMFAAISLGDTELHLILKCDPARVDELRSEYSGITPPRYFSKTHWNSCSLDRGVPDAVLNELLQHSYDLVVSKLTKKVRASLGLGG